MSRRICPSLLALLDLQSPLLAVYDLGCVGHACGKWRQVDGIGYCGHCGEPVPGEGAAVGRESDPKRRPGHALRIVKGRSHVD